MRIEITKEEAIEGLKDNLCSMCAYGSQNMDSCNIRECDNRDYIKALEQPTSDDCVSREQAIKTISTDIQLNLEGRSGLLKYSDEIKDILKTLLDSQEKKLKALPPVTPTRKAPREYITEDEVRINMIELAFNQAEEHAASIEVLTPKHRLIFKAEKRGSKE